MPWQDCPRAFAFCLSAFAFDTLAVFPLLIAAFVLAVLPVSASPQATPATVPDASNAQPATPPSWLGRVNAGLAGNFPPPRSFTADYRITWSDVEAGEIEAKCLSPESGADIHTVIKAASTGGARLLYKLDATGTCVADRRTLRPVRFEQRQEASGKKTYTRVDFTPDEAVRTNTDPTGPPPADPAKAVPRHFPYRGMFDMHTALLYLRSLPLNDGDEKTFPVMASNTPYLVTVKVLDHERVKTKAGEYAAVCCSLSLEKINKLGELEAHKSFKSARAWISDDADRLLLKVETEVFVGSVNLELVKVTF